MKEKNAITIVFATSILTVFIPLIAVRIFYWYDIPAVLTVVAILFAELGVVVMVWKDRENDRKKKEMDEDKTQTPYQMTFAPYEIAEARIALVKHYSDQQTAQGARLIGFVAGLFALYQLAWTYMGKSFDDVFTILFPTNIIKIVLLLFGTTIILVFAIHTIFRFAVFSHFVTVSMGICEDDIKNLLRYDKENKNRPLLSCIHDAISKKVYLEKKVFWISARYFIPVDTAERLQKYFPRRTIVGYAGLLYLSLSFSILLIVILW
jgi:hypothetical protein